MPPAAPFIVSAVVKVAVSLAVSFVVGQITKALAPKPKTPTGSQDVSQTNRELTSMIRQSDLPRRYIFGERRVSGGMMFYETTNDKRYHHIILAIADHECDAVTTVYFDNHAIFADQRDGAGNVTAGKFANKARIRVHLGGAGQIADSVFVSEVGAVNGNIDNNFIGVGQTYLYVRTETDADLFPNVIPQNISAWVRGMKLLDTRTEITAWTPNGALCLHRYLTDTRFGRRATALEVDDTETDASANICDEIVDTAAVVHQVSAVDTAADTLELDGDRLQFLTGDRVEVSTSDALPAGLSGAPTVYYTIIHQEVAPNKIKLATSLANALTGTAVDITSGGTGQHTVTKTGEPRYTINGAFDSASDPRNVLDDMRLALAGVVEPTGGKWRILAGAWRAPTVTLQKRHVRGRITRTSRRSRRVLFNAVKGKYSSPLNFNQSTDYPPVTNAAYETEDGGERIFTDLPQPYTSRPNHAQRVAQIILRKHREQQVVDIPFMLHAFQIEPGFNFNYTDDVRGWSAQSFECLEAKFNIEESGGGPYLGVDIRAAKTQASVYGALGSEIVPPPLPTQNPLDPTDVVNPTGLTVTEVTYQTRESAGVKVRADVAWTAAADQFISRYELRWKRDVDSVYQSVSVPAATTSRTLYDLEPGNYEFGIRSVNQVGIGNTAFLTLFQPIQGLLAPPAPPSNMTIATIGGNALIFYDLADEDVKQGGQVIWRHSPSQTETAWQSTVSIGQPTPGQSNMAVLPLKPGTYFAKAVDSSGVKSTTFSFIATKGATVLNYANLNTVNEHPGFTGTKTNTEVISSALRLTTGNNSGQYAFAAGVDLTAVKNVRVTAQLTGSIFERADLIDSRTELIDDWEDFDGTVSSGADAYLELRHTDDDPAASPTWTAWQRVDQSEIEARGFEFRLQLSSEDAAFNISLTAVTVTIDELA